MTMTFPRAIVLAACVLAALSGACAQTQADAAPVDTASNSRRAGGNDAISVADPRRERVRAALLAAERGDYDAAAYADLAGHPLAGWIEFAALRRDLDTLAPARAQDFLARHGNQAVGETFRAPWLAAAARREDWTAFAAAWKPGLKSTELRCGELRSRMARGATDAQWMQDAQALWREGKAAPTCEPVFAQLDARGGLTDALRWERLDAAADAGQPGVMRTAARGLPPAESALAIDYAAFLEGVHARASRWPTTDRSRRIASLGLARLAKSAPGAAEAQLPSLADALGMGETDRGRVLYPIALWTVASYEPESARRLAAVPASAYDERLHEWRAREAMARSDWPAALAAIRAMPDKQRGDSRWQYFEARLAERRGDRATAEQLYRAAATKPEFHGFLAADRIRQPYALCPNEPANDAATKAAVARDPALLRALMLQQLQRDGWAVREWDDALSRFDDTRRRLAVEVAQQHGWFDRAVFALGKTPAGEPRPDELRLYHLRFPLHHADTIRREARNNRLDPAWVAAEIRAESIFMPNARSSANAMGLMQILPGTGAGIARRLGLPWGGADSLFDPDTNIVLGSAYLRELLDKYGGQPYHAIAGYNAGPAPLARWQSQRPGMDADFWIETISYKETRDYVARVLAFSVLYDWRLNGDAVALEDRMRGRLDGRRKGFRCPAAEAAPAAAAPAGAPSTSTTPR